MRHRQPASQTELEQRLGAVARRNALVLAVANLVAAAALGFGDPGTSPSMGFLKLIAPLQVWAVGFAIVGGLLIAKRHLAGHTVAALLWVMLAAGATIGVLAGTTRSPAASTLLAGVVLAVAGLHLNSMAWRRREAQERRTT